MNETQYQPDIENCLIEKQIEYKPSRLECLRDYEIRIKFLSIGCIIEVGCKSVPFNTIQEGMQELNEYIRKPYETRKIWEERFKKEEEL